MAGPEIDFDLTFERDPRLYARDHATFLRRANRDAAAFHHTRHIPRHFEHFAAAKYGYAPRSRRYQALKDRRGLPPLVFSGRSRGVITSQRTITSTQHQAKLLLRLPIRGASGRLRVKPGRSTLSTSQKTIHRTVVELETIADDEQRALAAEIEQRYTQLANTPGVPRKVRIRGR